MHCVLYEFTLILNYDLLFSKPVIFKFLLGTSETLQCSMSAPHVTIVPLLDVHQLLMSFAGTLTYSDPKLFSLTIFYIGPSFILKH
jgi:hypothetical protein